MMSLTEEKQTEVIEAFNSTSKKLSVLDSLFLSKKLLIFLTGMVMFLVEHHTIFIYRS